MPKDKIAGTSDVRWVAGSIVLAACLIVGGGYLLVALSHLMSHDPPSANSMNGVEVGDVAPAHQN